MGGLIDSYFRTHLQLSASEAEHLHKTYYQQYGLAIEGLVRHHKIDPLSYNAQVDDALPLEDVLAPNPALRALLLDIDRSKVKLWLFTNAYVNHGRRVVRLLGIEDLFEGITYCDYAQERILCKPHTEMYEKARREAGAGARDVQLGGRGGEGCWFVDDTWMNCRAATQLGWSAVHLLEPKDEQPKERAGLAEIRALEELRMVAPAFFLSTQHRENGEVGH